MKTHPRERIFKQFLGPSGVSKIYSLFNNSSISGNRSNFDPYRYPEAMWPAADRVSSGLSWEPGLLLRVNWLRTIKRQNMPQLRSAKTNKIKTSGQPPVPLYHNLPRRGLRKFQTVLVFSGVQRSQDWFHPWKVNWTRDHNGLFEFPWQLTLHDWY
jgi:hypothetical protein